MVHLLEAKAFAAQFQDSIVILFRSTIGMRLHQPAEPRGELIANLDHRFPPLAHSLQIVLTFRAQNDDAINREQLRLELARFRMKWGVKVQGDSSQPLFKGSQRPPRQLQEVQTGQAFFHGGKTTPSNLSNQASFAAPITGARQNFHSPCGSGFAYSSRSVLSKITLET